MYWPEGRVHLHSPLALTNLAYENFHAVHEVETTVFNAFVNSRFWDVLDFLALRTGLFLYLRCKYRKFDITIYIDGFEVFSVIEVT